MARPTSPILAADTGRAQAAALAVLAVLAGLQVLLLAGSWWLAARRGGEMKPDLQADGAGAGGAATSALGAPPQPGQLAGESSSLSTLAFSTGTATAPPMPGELAGDSAGLTTAPTMAAPLGAVQAPSAGTAARHPELEELLDTVRQLRPLDDTAGMLAVLRRCEELQPGDPEVQSEFALTYEQMGLNDKAALYWRKLAEAGPAVAGDFYGMAVGRLKELGELGPAEQPQASTQASVQTAAQGDQVLKIGPCAVVKDPAVTQGERITLRIPIQRLVEGYIEPTAVSVDVFFYDLVNGSKVEPTRADPPVSRWVAEPVDWSGQPEEEPLDMVYFLPPMSSQEVKDHGERQFYGYVVKLYYQNRLQDTAAAPPDLAGEKEARAGAGTAQAR
ncbi:MAG: hypothetical protein KDK99_05465 [Verrucomicrobiales bacterium]|nr:hypothetical protein [Verrucomicrobiales bacterium]